MYYKLNSRKLILKLKKKHRKNYLKTIIIKTDNSQESQLLLAKKTPDFLRQKKGKVKSLTQESQKSQKSQTSPAALSLFLAFIYLLSAATKMLQRKHTRKATNKPKKLNGEKVRGKGQKESGRSDDVSSDLFRDSLSFIFFYDRRRRLSDCCCHLFAVINFQWNHASDFCQLFSYLSFASFMILYLPLLAFIVPHI